MSPYLAWKLGLGTGGTVLALGSHPLGWPWLFPAGLTLVVVALVLPSYEGQTLKQKLSLVLRHLPGGRHVAPPSDRADDEGTGREA